MKNKPKKLWKDKLDLRANLQRRMPKLAAAYFEAGREALQPGVPWEEMHEFRLLTKRFRYTLEIFRGQYGPGIEQRIESLRKVQTYLGDINDAIVTSAMLESLGEADAFRKKQQKVAAQKTDKLRAFWAKSFDADGAEARWTRYLVTYACRSSAPKPDSAPKASPSPKRGARSLRLKAPAKVVDKAADTTQSTVI